MEMLSNTECSQSLNLILNSIFITFITLTVFHNSNTWLLISNGFENFEHSLKFLPPDVASQKLNGKFEAE